MSRNDDNSFVYEDLDDVQGNILFTSVDFLYKAWIPIITQSNQYYHIANENYTYWIVNVDNKYEPSYQYCLSK